MKIVNLNELEETARDAKFEHDIGSAVVTLSYANSFHALTDTITILSNGTISVGDETDTFSKFIEVVYDDESDDEDQKIVQRETAAKVLAILFDVFEVEDICFDILADNDKKKMICESINENARWYLENGFDPQ